MYRRIRMDLTEAVYDWKTDWQRMTARLIVSAILGQGFFWKFGYDQLSIGGKNNRIMQVGYGQRIGRVIYKHVPHTRRSIYGVKAAEILADLGKCFSEGATYDRYGIAPDVVACAVTQPTWSLIEAVEKLGSMVKAIDSYREIDEEEFVVAISCIYGSFFRYGQAAVILALGEYIEGFMTVPIERAIRRTGPLVPALAVLGASYGTWRVTKTYLAGRTA
jgi:hypothetical protein